MILFSIAHGVISLERHSPEFGVLRRRVQIPKMRGRAFREGYHDFRIREGGLEVFPRLVASEHTQASDGRALSSGVPRLDVLLGGGLSRGTSTLVIGPAPRAETTVQRIVRNTEMARRVKKLHDYRCQICGTRIEIAPGAYAE